MSPVITVVIATYHRPHLLRRCLDALLRQNIPGSYYEINVVDDGRSDDTRDVVSEFIMRSGGSPVMRYLQPISTHGPAGARNAGWRAAITPLIAFTDDDTIPAPNWLHQGIQAMSPDVVALGGALTVPIPTEPTDHEKNTQGLERAEFATANAFVWRSALVKVGGFDERFTRAWREDSDLHFSLLELGGRVGWAPLAVVEHPVRAERWGVSLRQQANVYFDALLYKKHPRLYRLKIRPVPPWHYYVVVLATLAAVAALLAGIATLGCVLLCVALLGVAGLTLQRLKGTSHTLRHVTEMALTSLAIPFLSVYWRLRGALRFHVLFF